MAISLGYMAFALFRKWRGWSRGMEEPAAASGKFCGVAKIWLAEVFLHRQLLALSFSRWVNHLLIFYGFIGLALLPLIALMLDRSGYLALSSTSPHFYLYPTGYLLIKLWGDTFGLMLLSGLILSCIRRFLIRPVQQANDQLDVVLLALLFFVTLSGFCLEGLRASLLPAEIARYSYVGRFFTLPGSNPFEQARQWLTATWMFHFLLVASLFAYLPHSKLMHSLLAPMVIGMNAAAEHVRKDLYWPEMKKYRPAGLPQD
jgi:nitrate reductase gamma subunit